MIQYQFFATCPRGLEALLQDELISLGATALDPTDGGVGFAGDFALCYRANLYSRTATRIRAVGAAVQQRPAEHLEAAARDVR